MQKPLQNIIPIGSDDFLNVAHNTSTYACKLQIAISQNNFRNIFLRKPYNLEAQT